MQTINNNYILPLKGKIGYTDPYIIWSDQIFISPPRGQGYFLGIHVGACLSDDGI